jgi:hypothetical protein
MVENLVYPQYLFQLYNTLFYPYAKQIHLEIIPTIATIDQPFFDLVLHQFCS